MLILYSPHSPDDQKILEEEYRRNPKPDKAARIEIVSKVALGEKEVQVRELVWLLFYYMLIAYGLVDLVPE